MTLGPRIQAKRKHGSWFAQLANAEYPDWYPCIHEHWLKGTVYCDPGRVPGNPKWQEYEAALTKGFALLTKDEVVEGKPFKRTDYTALVSVRGVKAEAGNLHLEIVERLRELKK